MQRQAEEAIAAKAAGSHPPNYSPSLSLSLYVCPSLHPCLWHALALMIVCYNLLFSQGA